MTSQDAIATFVARGLARVGLRGSGAAPGAAKRPTTGPGCSADIRIDGAAQKASPESLPGFLPGLSPGVLLIASALTLSAGEANSQSSGLPDITTRTAPTSSSGAVTNGAAGLQSSAPVAGPAEQSVSVTSVPDSLPMVFLDEAGLLEQGRTVSRTMRVKGKLGQVIGTAADADRLREVVLRGAMDVADLEEGQRRAKVSWTSVIRPDTNRSAVLAAPLQSQFRTTGNVVTEGQQVNAVGDYKGLLDAVNSLYGDGPPPEESAASDAAAETTVSNELSTPGGEARGIEGGSAGSVDGSGGAQLSTPADFALPDVIGSEEGTDPVPVITESSENCPARVDLANNEVVFQSQTLQDGVPQGACQDTLDRFTLQHSFVGCVDEVDQAGGVARPTSRRYYVGKDGSTEYVDASCIADETVEFELSEDTTSCTIDVNLNTLKATVRAQLVYTDRNNRRVVVEDCRAQTGVAAIDIVRTEIGCALRDDFNAGLTYVQDQATYTRPDNVVAVAQSCTDTGETLAHSRVTTVCNVLTDLGGLLAIPQYRVQITKDGVASYRTDCLPDTANQVALQKDPAQCTTQFIHDLGSNVSYGTARLWHDLDGDGQRNFVTTCEQDTDVTYAHVERTTLYQHDDTTKTSRPSTEIFITTPGAGEVVVSSTQVRAGAATIAYTLNRQETAPNGNTTYDGCNKFTEQSVFNVYDRIEVSGTTEFQEFSAPGPTIGPVDACEQQVLGTWPHSSTGGGYAQACSTVTIGDDESGYHQVTRYRGARSCTYSGERRFYREDQTVVSSTPGSGSVTVTGSCGHTQSHAAFLGGSLGCSGSVTSQSNINSWATGLGWTVEGYY